MLMSPDMNLGWVRMSLNTGMLWLTPVGRGRAHAVLAISGTLSYTHPRTAVTFDAVVVKCFCHGGQSLLPCVTIGDQLEETD